MDWKFSPSPLGLHSTFGDPGPASDFNFQDQDTSKPIHTTCDLGSSAHALALKEIVTDCEQSCAKLTELLTSLSLETTTPQTINSKEPTARARWSLRSKLGFNKIEIGIKSIWKKEEIEELEMRIAKSRD